MKKSIYIAAFAALALVACTNEEDRVFDQSAADRLEQYKKDYSDVLTSDGGLWRMEYFANEEEPGYVFLMKFDKNGSVTMSANHKWIGNEFKQETSLWKMIADNGPVLSFNSYNNLFHIFSDPANITGPYAPTNPDNNDKDIDETGFGHEGDYEFQVMEVSDDQNTVRLLGKKRLYTIYLHRVNESTNAEEYLESVSNATSFLSSYFDYFNLVDATGEPFIVKGIESGIVSMYPKNGDFVTQTRSGSVIFTPDGMRYMKPLEVPRADESADPYEAYEFKFQPDGSLLAEDGARIVGPYPTEAFLRETFKFKWHIDLATVTGNYAAELKKLNDAVVAAYPKKVVEDIYYSYEVVDGETVPAFNIKLTGTKEASYYLHYTSSSTEGIDYEIFSVNANAITLGKKIPYLETFVDIFVKTTFTLKSDNVMSADILTLTSKNNPNDTMVVEIL